MTINILILHINLSSILKNIDYETYQQWCRQAHRTILPLRICRNRKTCRSMRISLWRRRRKARTQTRSLRLCLRCRRKINRFARMLSGASSQIYDYSIWNTSRFNGILPTAAISAASIATFFPRGIRISLRCRSKRPVRSLNNASTCAVR